MGTVLTLHRGGVDDHETPRSRVDRLQAEASRALSEYAEAIRDENPQRFRLLRATVRLIAPLPSQPREHR